MKFKYKAQKTDGTFYEATRDAEDKYALARELTAEGETLIFALEEGEGGHFNVQSLFGFFRHVSIHEKVTFARNLGGMIGAGLPISRAFAVLERQTRKPKMKEVIVSLNRRIGTGESLSQVLASFPDIFPAVFTAMVKAGEEGGNLASALSSIADQLNRTYLLQKKVKGALLYPAIVMLVMVIIAIVMFVFIVPQLAESFKEFDVALPLSTRIIIGISDFLKEHTLLGFLVVIGTSIGAWVGAHSAPGKRFLDFLVLHMPIISPLVKEANAARTGTTLSSLLSAGVPIIGALEITAEVLGNTYYHGVLFSAREAIQKGDPMSTVFRDHEDIYPAFLSEMIAVGEETGKLSIMLKETGLFFESEVDQKTKDLSTIIEPLLMVVVGAAVGFFAVAMISPAYSLMSSI